MSRAAAMQRLNPDLDLDDFFRGLAVAPARVLVLDYDGTLAPFHPNPAQAYPYPGVMELLGRITTAGHSRTVLASGRWTRDLLPLIDLPVRPEIWGSHGRERLWPDGRSEILPVPPAALAALLDADEWAGALTALGARLECKPASLAVHWRGLAAEKVARIRGEVRRWGRAHAKLQLLDFDGGVELRDGSCDKGRVIRTLAAELGPGARFAYLGDDITDEDAFRALPSGGLGVLVRNEPRPTAASLWLRPPGELCSFLERWHASAKPA